MLSKDNIEEAQFAKLLGKITDSKLTWDNHNNNFNLKSSNNHQIKKMLENQLKRVNMTKL